MNQEWLKIVARHHKEYVKLALMLGAGSYAEDIVQEAYLKIYKYANPNKIIQNGNASRGYMFFVIRSIFLSYIKKKNKIKVINIDDFFKDEDFLEIKSVDIERLTANDNLERENAWGRLINKMDKQIETWQWYHKRIFEVYRDTPLSIRGIAKETKISFVNIFHTLKKGKNILREKFSEDYEDYINKDYNKI